MKNIRLIIILALVVFLFSGGALYAERSPIVPGMTKDEVKEEWGEPIVEDNDIYAAPYPGVSDVWVYPNVRGGRGIVVLFKGSTVYKVRRRARRR